MESTLNFTQEKWSLPKKILFRFFFIYFLLFIILKNNNAFPFFDVLMSKPEEWLRTFVPWIGKTILNLPYEITIFTNGSADTTYDYIVLLLIAIVAVTGTIFWSFIDHNKPHYKKLYYWLSVAVRFYLALTLIDYALIKIIKLQFPSPYLYRLTETFGEASPMGLAWTFLGFSKGYNLFMGLAELSAVLLLFRRTLTAGLIITFMATLNVMAINFFYDVPVKIISSHLVLMTLFLLSRDLQKLFKFLFSEKPTQLINLKAPIGHKWFKPISYAMKIIVIGYVLIYGFYDQVQNEKSYGAKAPKPALYGVYEVIHFEKNGDTISPILNNSRWQKFFIEFEGYVSVYKQDKSMLFFNAKTDSTNQKIILTKQRDTLNKYVLNYRADDFFYDFNGIIENDTISLRARRRKPEDFPLMNRGFRWINERPYNR